MALTLVPCNHLWLEVANEGDKRIAVCKWCKKKGKFDVDGWEVLLVLGQAVNKPIRRVR